MPRTLKILTGFEWGLWSCSMAAVIISYVLSGENSILTLIASLIGVTALIFVAKGHVAGQMLSVVFAVVYAIISFQFRYYGEMITYMGMTGPIALMSVITWLKHPYEEGKAEIEIAHMDRKKGLIMAVSAVIVTAAFYFILKYFNNANLVVSTVSITTSYVASFLLMFRIPYYAIAYAANDIVLIVLWILAGIQEPKYYSMVVCFAAFLANDIYGFCNWNRMRDRQTKNSSRT